MPGKNRSWWAKPDLMKNRGVPTPKLVANAKGTGVLLTAPGSGGMNFVDDRGSPTINRQIRAAVVGFTVTAEAGPLSLERKGTYDCSVYCY